MADVPSLTRVVYALNVLLLVILVVALPFIDRDSGAFVALVLSLVPITITFLGIAVVKRTDISPFGH